MAKGTGISSETTPRVGGAGRAAHRRGAWALSFVALCILLSLAAAPARVEAVTAWVSGPVDALQIAFKAASAQSALAAALRNDIDAALSTLSLTPAPTVSAPGVTLALQKDARMPYGVLATFTLANQGSLTDEEVLQTLHAASLPDWDAAARTVFSGSFSSRVLPVNDPSQTQSLTPDKLMGISGPSFIWDLIFTTLGAVPDSLTLLQLPLTLDLQSILDPNFDVFVIDVKSQVTSRVTNATGYYAGYSVYTMGATRAAGASAEDVYEKLLNQDLPQFSAQAQSIPLDPDNQKYLTLIPAMLTTTTHLLPNPSAGGDTPIITNITNTVDTTAVLYFTGTTSGWESAVARDRDAFDAALITSLNDTFQRTAFVNTFTVDTAYVRFDATQKVEGLCVHLTLHQGETALSRHTYNSAEVGSILANGRDYTSVLAFYTDTPQSASASITGLPMPSFASARPSGNYGMQCTAGCVGMIIMAAIAAFLMILIFLIFIIAVCCCHCGSEKDDGASGDRESGRNRDVLVDPDNVPETAHRPRYNEVSPNKLANPLYPRASQGMTVAGFEDEGPSQSGERPGLAGGGVAGEKPPGSGSTDGSDSFHARPAGRWCGAAAPSPVPSPPPNHPPPPSGNAGDAFDKADKKPGTPTTTPMSGNASNAPGASPSAIAQPLFGSRDPHSPGAPTPPR